MAGLGKETDPVFEKTFIMTNISQQLKVMTSLVYSCLILLMNMVLSQMHKEFVVLIVDVLMILSRICLTRLNKSVDISYQLLFAT